jgi:hypothetical protein
MTKEKLKRCNELAKEIKETEDNIKIAKFTQSETLPQRPMYIEFLGSEQIFKAPDTLFKIIGKLILNEYQQKLIELETEFDNL